MIPKGLWCSEFAALTGSRHDVTNEVSELWENGL
jgi:hypothetical protein